MSYNIIKPRKVIRDMKSTIRRLKRIEHPINYLLGWTMCPEVEYKYVLRAAQEADRLSRLLWSIELRMKQRTGVHSSLETKFPKEDT